MVQAGVSNGAILLSSCYCPRAISNFLIHYRVNINFGLIGGLQDSMGVVLDHLTMTRNCQVGGASEPQTSVLQDRASIH